MATSENFRFKKAFEAAKPSVHTPKTRTITAQTLTDEDVLVLIAHGRGHLVEPIPGREKEAEAVLKKLAEPKDESDDDDQDDENLPSLSVNKPELQAIYEAELGQKPDDELRVDDLKAAIRQHRNTPK